MSTEEAPTPASPSRRFAGYDLVAKVGAHKGASTFRAIQVTLGRPVLVTVLPPEAARVPLHREHFHRQQAVAARLRHDNVISAIDAGTFKGCRYFVTEDVAGRTLADDLAGGKRLEIPRALAVARDLARALAHLAGEGILHRNVCPANVLVTDEGVVKLVGFGRAKDKAPNGAETWIDHDVESALHLAPELLAGERGLDPRADVYSLGCVLYHMLTGRPPHVATTSAAVLEAHATSVPPDPREFRPELPSQVVDVLDRALRRKREHRYAKAEEFAADLETVRLGRPLGKHPDSGALWPSVAAKFLPRLGRRK